ncbi:hypothetical protein CHU98_g12614 [Xylaria longipes]|nr:hypothetical protein CHU98_g12614 [Xylaria longipes]
MERKRFKTVTWYSIDLPKRSIPTKELINVYRHRSEDGFGRMVTGNVMIEHDHLQAARNPIIPREALFQGEQFDVFWGIAAAEKARQLGRGPAVTSRPSGVFQMALQDWLQQKAEGKDGRAVGWIKIGEEHSKSYDAAVISREDRFVPPLPMGIVVKTRLQQ